VDKASPDSDGRKNDKGREALDEFVVADFDASRAFRLAPRRAALIPKVGTGFPLVDKGKAFARTSGAN